MTMSTPGKPKPKISWTCRACGAWNGYRKKKCSRPGCEARRG